MRQTTSITNECTPAKKVRIMELHAELRELKSAESLADYECCKGTLPEWQWSEMKERIRIRSQNLLAERSYILNGK